MNQAPRTRRTSWRRSSTSKQHRKRLQCHDASIPKTIQTQYDCNCYHTRRGGVNTYRVLGAEHRSKLGLKLAGRPNQIRPPRRHYFYLPGKFLTFSTLQRGAHPYLNNHVTLFWAWAKVARPRGARTAKRHINIPGSRRRLFFSYLRINSRERKRATTHRSVPRRDCPNGTA